MGYNAGYNAECLYAECHYTECHYTECRRAEGHDAVAQSTNKKNF